MWKRTRIYENSGLTPEDDKYVLILCLPVHKTQKYPNPYVFMTYLTISEVYYYEN